MHRETSVTHRSREREDLQELLTALETAVEALAGGPAPLTPVPWLPVARIARGVERHLWDPSRTELGQAIARLRHAAPGEMADVARAVLAVARRALERPATRPARLLIVEDDGVVATGIARTFEHHGWEATIVEEAASALAILRSEPVTAVLLDLVLPDADGRNVLLNVRDDPRLATLPVYVASARMDDRVEQECLALGAQAVFRKPLELAQVVHRVDIEPPRPIAVTRPMVLSRAELREEFEATAGLQRCVGLAVPRAAAGDAGSRLDILASALAEHLGERGVVAQWTGDEVALLFANLGQAAARRLVGGAESEGLAYAAGIVDVAAGAGLDRALDDAGRLLLAAQATPTERTGAQDAAAAPPRRMVVLAEDDRVTATLLLHRFQREPGLELLHFADGSEAYTAILERRPALAILDIQMPGMDGLSLLRALRESSDHAAMPIIMLTALGSERDIVRGLEMGASDYVVKPFSPAELLARARRLLGRERPT